MINKLFVALRDEKGGYLNAKKGSEFEDRIAQYLQMTLGFSRILKTDVSDEDWKLIKEHIGNKYGSEFLKITRPTLKRTFIYQPYGSQQFPDFLIFTNKNVIPLEIKFSAKKQSKPIWNSNIPRANAFYIFGSYGLKDITFFCGDDVLAPEHRERLYGFFKDIKIKESEIRKRMPALDVTNRGFTPYIRAAFDQQKHSPTVEVGFFNHPDRQAGEDKAIKRISLLESADH